MADISCSVTRGVSENDPLELLECFKWAAAPASSRRSTEKYRLSMRRRKVVLD